jgi:hypothetical protein
MGFSPCASALRGHEARLRHRPFDRIDEQQHAIDHRQHALHLAAEVGVAGRVDDVDVHALVIHRGVLREDGDAALALDVVGVHHALDEMLVSGEGTRLAKELVDQRGLAVVDVGDDGYVAERAGHGCKKIKQFNILAPYAAPHQPSRLRIQSAVLKNACSSAALSS